MFCNEVTLILFKLKLNYNKLASLQWEDISFNLVSYLDNLIDWDYQDSAFN